jgi:Bacterial protein of unknown function (DUF922)
MASSHARAQREEAEPEVAARDLPPPVPDVTRVGGSPPLGSRAHDVGGVEAAGRSLLARLALAPPGDRARVLARMQRGLGNARVARMLPPAGRLAVAREPGDGGAPEVDAAPAPDAAPLQAAPGQSAAPAAAPAPAPAATRPPVTTLTNNCADCNAAVAILNANTYVGEADVQIQWAGVGDIRVTKTKTGFVATSDVSWTLNVATSKMEVTEFVWPGMTPADSAAVAAFKAALLAHEEEHFRRVEAALPTLPKTFSGTGATSAKAVEALKANIPGEVTKTQAAVQKITDDYDAKTKHGRTQSAVGGTDVKLTCPPPAKPPAAPPAGSAPAP